MINYCIRFFSTFVMRRDEDLGWAKILNRGTIVVGYRGKRVYLPAELDFDFSKDDSPAVVAIGASAHWGLPVDHPMTTEEIDALCEFIPGELLRRDGITSVVEIIGERKFRS